MICRSRSLLRCTMLLLAYVFCFLVVAFADDGDAQLEEFYIISKDGPASGGCTPDEVKWLSDAFTEAMKMVRGAIADIDFPSRPRSQDNVDDQRRWDKTVSLLTRIFGITPVPQGGIPDAAQRSRLKNAKGVYLCKYGQMTGRSSLTAFPSYHYTKIA